jgi:hydroxymethylglutaryl-CoA synthase
VLDGLFRKTGVEPGDISHFVFPCTYPRLPQAVAKKAGLPETSVRDNLHAVCGETGTAHPLVMLVDALQDAKPGELILVAAFGQGCDALLFRATEALPRLPARRGIKGALRRRKAETNYNKFLAFNDLVTIERGMRAEVDKQTALSTLYRKKDMLLGLVGGRCERCGTVQFPKTNVCVNPNCNALHSQADHPFADIPAKVMSYTADRLTYTPDPPAHYGMVQFDGGGRMMIDFADVDEGSLEVGMPMRMAFRVKEYDPQRGFTKYFWKAVPA